MKNMTCQGVENMADGNENENNDDDDNNIYI